MPSPFVHGSLVFLARPLLMASAPGGPAPRHGTALLVCVLVALNAPDIDFLLRWLFPASPAFAHGMATHGLPAVAVIGLLFAAVARVLIGPGVSFGRLLTLGLACALSHVLLDALTHGRGVALFWPVWPERIQPFVLFLGVKHSQPLAWKSHLLTLATELLFVLPVWLLGRRLMSRVEADAHEGT